MSGPRIGAVTIGQAPRPDLVEPLLDRAAGTIEVLQVGALDGLTIDQLPAPASRHGRGGQPGYPLTTRLRDGTPVTLDEADLAPLVQQAVDRAEDAGTEVVLLLCAGGFLDVAARGTLIRPFDAAVARLHELGAGALAVVVPYPGQADPARRKWEAAGFRATVVVGHPADLTLPADTGTLDAVVLDYVGHPSRDVEALRERTELPVVDLGACGAEAAIAAAGMPLQRVAAAGR